MNSPDPDSRFEDALSSFRRPPLPSEWREDLLDKALPSPTRATDEVGLRRALSRLTRSDRALAAMLALAWFVIGVLWVTKPAGNPGSPSRMSAHPHPAAVPAGDWPTYAWRTRNLQNFELFLKP
jgi:hypothetical protein